MTSTFTAKQAPKNPGEDQRRDTQIEAPCSTAITAIRPLAELVEFMHEQQRLDTEQRRQIQAELLQSRQRFD